MDENASASNWENGTNGARHDGSEKAMQVIQEAEEKKQHANSLFAQGQVVAAKAAYTHAIEMNHGHPWPIALSNRAACELRMEEEGAALADANKALELDPTYMKAYYRRASAQIQLGQLKPALRDIQLVLKKTGDANAKQKEKECRAAVQRMRFEQAIARHDNEGTAAGGAASGASTAPDELGTHEPDPADVDPNNVNVEPEYNGPRLEGENEDVVTESFVHSLLEHLRDEKKLHKKYALRLIHQAKAVLENENTVVDVPISRDHGGCGTLTICGDVHGQYYDFLNIFKLNGMPSPENPYLFNGDFVDRGSFSVEVILALFAIKILHPRALTLIRGNHETTSMNRIYGFHGEVQYKYNSAMVHLFAHTFCALPIAALLGQRVLVLHGGLFSRDDVTLNELREVDRFREQPERGLLCEALWSDPQPANGRSPSKRGVGVAFGPDVTNTFLQNNGLEYIIRSHEMKDAGYEVAHDSRCITVFSAPNYCDHMGNKGAYIVMKEDLIPTFHTFSAVVRA